MKLKSLDINTQIINKNILHFTEIDSTNLYLLNQTELNNGTVAVADFQTAGRGRLTRKWEAPQEDALLFSLLINKNLNFYHPAAFTFIAALAVLEGMKKIYYDFPAILKWPNDIIINGKKLCGILVESRSAGQELSKVVTGIGVNVNQTTDFFEENNLHHATSLKLATGQDTDRFYLLEALLESLEENLLYAQNRNISDILTKWKKYCPHIGRKVKLLEKNKEYHGVFTDLNPEGGIILTIDGEQHTFYAADVSLDKDSL